jgi:hypothetical protein
MKRNSRLERLVDEINVYLAAHPSAEDTLEGICSWWLDRCMFKDASPELVREALAHLENNGCVTRRSLADGTVTYSLAKDG